MTITTVATRSEIDGDDSTTAFTAAFKFLADADLTVILHDISAGTDAVQTLTTHYTVAGAGDASGTVTFGTPPPSGQKVVIYNDPDLTQTTDYVAGAAFGAETHEAALDKLTILAKRTREIVTRTPTLQDGDVDGSGEYDAKLNQIKRLGATTGTYTLSNVSAIRVLDADATSVAELADVLGTLINDLKVTGIVK
ncbi:MAG: hypothetical protein CMF57_13220 [Leifsonia sp.]|jgi:hypothetical protein|nr:hypothetical protein [Leifsonia sp.]|tara:strand:+ start:2446 stop:3030 length:585 start_codon:yes stop_codon:yes gene_type:complete